MTWLLDTNACIALINGRPASVRDRYRAEVVDGELVLTSVVTVFELWYGVAKSRQRDLNAQRLAAFLSGPVEVIDLDADDAKIAGEIRSELEGRGTPIGPYDLLIAAQAVQRRATLVTANTSEFSRVTELHWEDWAD